MQAVQAGSGLHHIDLEVPVKMLWSTIAWVTMYLEDTAQAYVLGLLIGQHARFPERAGWTRLGFR